LRPLELAEAFCIANEFSDDVSDRIPLEVALSRALDETEKRNFICFGAGQERWGIAQVSFDNSQWVKEIAPFFARAVAILSLPGRTPGCIKESKLIREFPGLCNRTVFVIPPMACFLPRSGEKTLDAQAYFRDVKREHEKLGIFLPDAEENVGVFVTLDPSTGRVRKRLEWQTVQVRTTLSMTGEVLSEEIAPSLTKDRIIAAVCLPNQT
jgi:hypothetical protein